MVNMTVYVKSQGNYPKNRKQKELLELINELKHLLSLGKKKKKKTEMLRCKSTHIECMLKTTQH